MASVQLPSTHFFEHSGRPLLPDSPRRRSSLLMPSSKDKSHFLNRVFSRKGSSSKRPATTTTTTTTTTTPRGERLAPQSNTPFSGGSPATRRPNRPGLNAFIAPSNEQPPPYSPTPGASQGSSADAGLVNDQTTAPAADDPYAFLRSFDTIFLIDDSGSMAGRSWRETKEALQIITPICTTHDADGIDVYFLNRRDSFKNITTASTVVELFQTVKPGGGTPTGQRLSQILRPYVQRYEANPDNTKPINLIVITDGKASDDVKSSIIWAAKELDKLDAPAWQVGIQFFQVGDEPGARAALKQLDDGLQELSGDGELRDMVDTVPFTAPSTTATSNITSSSQHDHPPATLTAAGILKVVLGSVNRRLDRNSKELHRRT